MKVGIVHSDVPSCELYRARGPAEHLAEQGDIELVEVPSEITVRYALRRHGLGASEPVGVKNVPEELNVLVMVRGVLPARVVEIIPLLQRQGIAVVVDVDDDYERLPPTLQSLYKINPTLNPLYNWRNVRKGCQLADLVTCSTPALQRYGRDSIMLRNCIPDRYLDIGRRVERDGKTVGWGGTVFGHPGDLRVPGAGVAEAIREAGGRFLNVGDGVDVQRDLSLDDPPIVTGIVPLADYPRQIARFDVGIAPLTTNSYTKCKSALKYLESLSMGSTVVASDTSEYVWLQHQLDDWCARNGCPVPGAVAQARSRDWRKPVLRGLTLPDSERQEVAEAGRTFVEEGHVISKQAYRWAEAWEEAIRRRRDRMFGPGRVRVR